MKKPFELEADMRQAFRSLDNSGNGMISETDLRVLLGTLGEPMDNTDVSLPTFEAPNSLTTLVD